jgi:hypothetical protein
MRQCRATREKWRIQGGKDREWNVFMFEAPEVIALSHSVFKPKLNAYSMCAQQHVFTHIVKNVNIEN